MPNIPKSGTISQEIGMIELMPDDRIKWVSHECPSRWDCLHYTRELEEGLTWIMPLNTGVDCVDFEPVEDE